MTKIAIIPARGGSKRIPRKNIKSFLGKPIIAYSIEAALQSKLFDEVMVSTDDAEIAEIALFYGAKVPFLRSKENANDFATTIDVLREVVSKYQEINCDFDEICCLYPTAPFVTAEKLRTTVQLFQETKVNSLLPVVKFGFPIQRAFEVNGSKIQYKFEEFKNARSQDLKPCFHDAGQFYWLKKEVLQENSIVTNNTGYFEISEMESQDIDTLSDWKLAELKYELLQNA